MYNPDSKIIDPINQYKNQLKFYSDLPRKYITFHNKKRPIVSYGAIVYAKNTRKWCLVQRTNSPEFTSLIKGNYTHAMISVLKSGLSIEEVTIMKNLINNPSPEEFKKIYELTVPGSDWEFGYTKFLDCKQHLLCLIDYVPLYQTTEWLWPKGKPNRNEQQKATAIREFFEETKIKSANLKSVSSQPIIESYLALNGIIYQTKCWVFIIDKQIPIGPYPIMSEPTEIKDGQWVDYNDAYRMLRDYKKSTIVQAERLVKEYML